MANKNQVTLTFGSDTAQATKAFGEVGDAAEKMGGRVHESGEAFERAAEGFDKSEQRAMGFRDTITGVQDSVKGFGAVLKGDFSGDALLTAGAGIGDLSSGFANLIVPMGKVLATTVSQTAALVAQKTASLATAAATKVATAAQWLWNIAMEANPIGAIIALVVLLVAAIVLIATKTTWFQDIWRVTWTWVKKTAVNVWDWLKGLPDRLGSVFSKIPAILTWPFRTAFNFIADAWNNTIGNLQWSVPAWVPFIGGNTIGAPRLPKFHGGGVVPGAPGSEMLAVLQAGERVTPAGAAGAPVVLELRSSGTDIDDLLVRVLQRAIKVRGGNVQMALGR
jgi:hypothetical protein